ncbi:MAG: hypothetical protein HPY55_07310 [Firmicutes bacterium]|nr:hypothetical protein [Bacillota bacterium]
MDDRGDFLVGMLLGGIIGFAAGVLFAPASGQETRESIVKKGKELAGDIRERKDEVTEAVRGKTREIFTRLRERLPMTKEVCDALDQVERESPGVG